MKTKTPSLFLPKLVTLTLATSLLASVGFAGTPNEALYENRADVESAQVNLDDAQAGFDMSADELRTNKDNYAGLTADAQNTARRIREEIAELDKAKLKNMSESKKLSAKIVSLKQEIRKHEAAEKKAQQQASVVQSKFDKVSQAHSETQARSEKNKQSLADVKARLSQAQKDLKAKNQEWATAKANEKRSAIALKKAQADYQAYRAKSSKELQRLAKEVRISQANAARNEKNANLWKNKKQKLEASVEAKREKINSKKSLGRLSLN